MNQNLLDFITWENLARAADSAFFTALFSSLAGAFFGALAAQNIGERAKEKDRLLTQLRELNVATTQVVEIFGIACGIKSQHLEKMIENYSNNLNKYKIFNASSGMGYVVKLRGEIDFQMDLKTLDDFDFGIEFLLKTVLEKVSISEKSLFLVMKLRGVIKTVERLSSLRNMKIMQFKNSSSVEKLHMYFGTKDVSGTYDTEYQDILYGIFDRNDDVIMFSKLLCEMLNSEGRKLRDNIEKEYGIKSLTVVSLKIVDLTLIPSESKYVELIDALK